MELSKKTTILFSPDLHERLSEIARQKRVSFGELVRRACETHYGVVPEEDRVEAVDQLAALALPVADPATMKSESMPSPAELLP